jgi:hypothetical protein
VVFHIRNSGISAGIAAISGFIDFGRASGCTLLDEPPILIEQEKAADTTI